MHRRSVTHRQTEAAPQNGQYALDRDGVPAPAAARQHARGPTGRAIARPHAIHAQQDVRFPLPLEDDLILCDYEQSLRLGGVGKTFDPFLDRVPEHSRPPHSRFLLTLAPSGYHMGAFQMG